VTNIRDPLYGYLELSDEETRILNSDHMQRLRRVKQLGFSSLVYPGATHNRFEHSLGVMHLTGRFADSLELEDEKRRELRMAALLHDAGHGPFSHTSEIIAEDKGKSHEDYSCEIADRIDGKHSLNTLNIKKIIRGKTELGSIVAGDIDADRMDYLMRDAHASGLEYGQIDYETIIRCAKVKSGKLVYSSKAIEALESLFTSRFHMYKTLYDHHTARITKMMLGRAFRDLNQEMDADRIMRMDDYEADQALVNSSGPSKELYTRIRNRELFKRCLEWETDDVSREQMLTINNRIDREKAEREIAEAVELEPHEIIVDPPHIPEIEKIEVKIEKEDEIISFSDVSGLQKALKKAEWRNVGLRVYGPKEKREEIKKASEDVLEGFKQILNQYT